MLLNLKQIYVVEDKEGNPHGFGPGEADVPDWAVERIKAVHGEDVSATGLKAGEPPVGLPENTPTLPPNDGSPAVLGVSDVPATTAAKSSKPAP